MGNESLIRTLSVLGQETRLSIYQLLCEFGDVGACPSDIAEKLSVAAATLSFHLKSLTQAGLLDAEADGRFIRYRANHQRTRELVRYAAKHLCGLKPGTAVQAPALEAPAAKAEATTAVTQPPADVAESSPAQQQLRFEPPPAPNPEAIQAKKQAIAPASGVGTAATTEKVQSRIRLRPVRILFLSPGNAARGILAEALTNHLGNGRFAAFSAGSQPLRRVNRYALRQLELAGCEFELAQSKSWEEFVGANAPEIDLVVGFWTAKSAPIYPAFKGRCQRLYWPVSDPSTVTASVHEAERAFANCYQSLSERIQSLLDRIGEQLDNATNAALG